MSAIAAGAAFSNGFRLFAYGVVMFVKKNARCKTTIEVDYDRYVDNSTDSKPGGGLMSLDCYLGIEFNVRKTRATSCIVL